MWWLIDMCVTNSYTLHLDTKAKMIQLDFRRALLDQIPAAFPLPARGRKRRRPGPPSALVGPHYPKHTDEQRDYRHCSGGQEARKRRRVMCDRCDIHLRFG